MNKIANTEFMFPFIIYVFKLRYTTVKVKGKY